MSARNVVSVTNVSEVLSLYVIRMLAMSPAGFGSVPTLVPRTAKTLISAERKVVMKAWDDWKLTPDPIESPLMYSLYSLSLKREDWNCRQ